MARSGAPKLPAEEQEGSHKARNKAPGDSDYQAYHERCAHKACTVLIVSNAVLNLCLDYVTIKRFDTQQHNF